MTQDMDRIAKMVLCPIGTVRSQLKERPDARNERLRQLTARIELLPEFWEGLDGLAPGDEIAVLFWLHRMRAEELAVLKVHPRGDTSRELKGVFATRSPARPNPIGVTYVQVMACEAGALVVQGLDALDGTPVLDIKIRV